MPSLDHATWFQRSLGADEGHLYAQEIPSGSGACGFYLGHISRRDGAVAVPVAQEGLVRPVREGGAKQA